MKIVTLIIALLFTVTCFGQQIEFSNMASVKASSKMQKMQREDVLSTTGQRLAKQSFLRNYLNNNSNNMYSIDGIMILIKVVPRTPSFKLQDQKLTLQTLGPANIETLNGNKFLLGLDTTNTDVAIYHFFCVNASNTTQVSGLITADEKDKEKAKAIVYDLIKGIKFKVQ